MSTPPIIDLVPIALAYLARGFGPVRVCGPAPHTHGEAPCPSPGKSPAPHGKGWPRYKDQLPTEAEVRRNFTGWRQNIGLVVPRGYVVLDHDPRAAKGLRPTPWEIFLFDPAHALPPLTPMVHTGGGGSHLFLRLPPGIELPGASGNFAAFGMPELEWKGPGTLIIAPPSVHVSGKTYRHDDEFSLA